MQGYNGAMVQWCNGAMVQWYNGTMVQWCNGAMVQCGSVTACERLWVLTSYGALGRNYGCSVTAVWLWGLGAG